MRERRFPFVTVVSSVLLLLCVGLTQAANVVGIPAVGSQARVSLTTAVRSSELLNVLNQANLSAEVKNRAVNDFNRLPADAQDIVLANLSPTFATKNGLVSAKTQYKISDRINIKLLTTPSIDWMLPVKASAGNWVTVDGFSFTTDCVVKFDGVEQPTTFYLGMLLFKAPASNLGSTHNVTVWNKVRNLESNVVNIKIVAPMGYRGNYGWQFANFGSADFGWNVYRDYFTPAAVEYSNGAHRASAQAWFDGHYKHVGNGGCCYGFSLRSVRTRRQDYSGCYASWWPGHTQSTVWDYPWTDPQIGDSIREDQGGQLCAQSAALINDRWNHQSHLQAATLMWNAIASGDTNRQPIMCMWIGNGYGHAIVAYDMAWDGTQYKIFVYDNNKPYSETETSDHDSLAHVYANGSFSYLYGSSWPAANRMLAFSFNELTYATPLLPTEAGGTTGLASGCTVVLSDSPNAIQQITDENGHTFFANGQENTNQGSRIPDSMKFVPMGGSLTRDRTPDNTPAIFIFNHSAGKSFTFDMAGNAANTVRVFSPKSVTVLNAQRGQFTLRNVMQPTQEISLPTPDQTGLQSIQMISVQPDKSERVFQMQNFQNLTPGALKFSLSPTGDAVQASGIPAKFNLNIQGQSNSGIRNAAMSNVAIQAGRTTAVTVPDFRSLQNSTLRLENR